MPASARLALFAALLVAVFSGAALLGGAVDPEGSAADEGHAPAHGGETTATTKAAGHGDEHGANASPSAEAALPGLAVAQDGHRLVLSKTSVGAGRSVELSFRIVDDEGTAVRAFEEAHEKRMHFIVVRRDARRFQHLHPTMAPDGTWAARVDLSEAGTYRVFADFTLDGEQRTLGADVHVPGAFDPKPVPAPAETVRDDRGLEVRLDRDGGRVGFTVLRDGRPINDELEDYLGAKGHLVTLRLGDLAYLHTHPEGDELAFETELPSAGTYRLWVQFQLDGKIHTAAFTQEVTS